MFNLKQNFTAILVIIISFCNAQKVDMDNAPKNPTGFKHKKEHFFLRGDIYSSAGKIFDKKGNLVFNYGTRHYYNDNNKITGNNYNDIFEYDSRGNIIKFQYSSGSTSNYKFDSKDLLIYEKSSYGDVKNHTYDSKGRVIKTTIEKKGKLSQTRTYKYSKKGDSLVVDMKYQYANGRSDFQGTSYYLKGYLVKEVLSSGTYRYKVELDKKGNKIDFYDIDKKDAKHFRNVNRYFSDAKKPLKIEFGYYKVYEDSKNKTETVYVNGKRSTDVAISKGTKPNEKIVYDGLTKTYYSVENIIPENCTIDTRIRVTKVLSKGNPYISYAYDGKFINYVHGYNKVKSRDFAFLGPHMIDYRIDKSLGRTYIIKNYKNIKNKAVKQMELLSADTTSLFYVRDLKNENFFIVDKGKHIDYAKARFEYLSNGDPVIFIDEKPTYVLTGFRIAEENEVLKGKRYTNELDNESNQNTNVNNSELECLEGDCTTGWGKIKVEGIITKATFKNGAIDGLAYINYPENSYYTGEYINNKRDGFGLYKWSSGNTYVGYWKNGKQEGYGFIINQNNEITSAGIYDGGNLKTNKFTDYKNKKISGSCTGECVNGFGTYIYSNGDKYTGFFTNAQRSDVGIYIWKNNSKYMGPYNKKGVRNGFGVYTYVDRSVFKGIFVNDKIDGLGSMLYNKSGNTVFGVFNNKGAKVRDY